jgi:hypothetical protein
MSFIIEKNYEQSTVSKVLVKNIGNYIRCSAYGRFCHYLHKIVCANNESMESKMGAFAGKLA